MSTSDLRDRPVAADAEAIGGLADTDLQALLAAALTEYAARQQAGRRFGIVPAGAELTATDAMIVATEVLQAADLQLFELGMWQALGGAA